MSLIGRLYFEMGNVANRAISPFLNSTSGNISRPDSMARNKKATIATIDVIIPENAISIGIRSHEAQSAHEFAMKYRFRLPGRLLV